jgi:hypothetical protein
VAVVLVDRAGRRVLAVRRSARLFTPKVLDTDVSRFTTKDGIWAKIEIVFSQLNVLFGRCENVFAPADAGIGDGDGRLANILLNTRYDRL